MKTSVYDRPGSKNSGRHPESRVNASMVIVANVLVHRRQHLARRIKTMDVTKLLLEAPEEGFNKAVLPGGSDITDGNLNAPLFQIIGAALRHEFGSLVGVKDRWGMSACQSLFQGRQHKVAVMTLADTSSDDLPGGAIFNGRQIPECATINQSADIAAPDLMEFG